MVMSQIAFDARPRAIEFAMVKPDYFCGLYLATVLTVNFVNVELKTFFSGEEFLWAIKTIKNLFFYVKKVYHNPK